MKAKLGIDYESVRKINPRIVYGSISGFGQDGPYHKRPGFDQIAQGMGGLMSITGAPGEGPMRVGIPVADLTAGLFCAMGILTALLEREVSGEGQWVQTSLLQAQIFMLDFQAARWLMEKDVAKQAGNDHPTSIPTGVFRTSDGYINIATTGGRIWQRFAEALGAPDLPNRPEYLTGPDRSKNRKQLNAEINKLHGEIERSLGQGVQRRRRPLRPDLFDRPGVRGPRRCSIWASRRTRLTPRGVTSASSVSRSRCRARRAKWRPGHQTPANRPTGDSGRVWIFGGQDQKTSDRRRWCDSYKAHS